MSRSGVNNFKIINKDKCFNNICVGDLKVSGQISGARFTSKTLTADTTLTLADSGTTYVIIPSASTFNINLPPPVSGIVFNFFFFDPANLVTITSTSNNISGVIVDGGAPNISVLFKTVLTFTAGGPDLGSSIELIGTDIGAGGYLLRAVAASPGKITAM